MGYTLYVRFDILSGKLPPPLYIGLYISTVTINNQKVFKRVMNYEAYANNSLR